MLGFLKFIEIKKVMSWSLTIKDFSHLYPGLIFSTTKSLKNGFLGICFSWIFPKKWWANTDHLRKIYTIWWFKYFNIRGLSREGDMESSFDRFSKFFLYVYIYLRYFFDLFYQSPGIYWIHMICRNMLCIQKFPFLIK